MKTEKAIRFVIDIKPGPSKPVNEAAWLKLWQKLITKGEVSEGK
jgi:hypothetical protein